jgi:hypothetical protein
MNILRDPNGGDGGSIPVPFDPKSLPADLAGNPSIQNFKTVPDLVKSFISAQAMIGQKRLPAPEPNWTEQQYNDFYKQIGRPDAPEAYDYKDIKTPEGLQIDKDRMKAASETFHKLGLTPKQARGLMEYYGGILHRDVTAATEKQTNARAASEQTLKSEWGDKYDASVGIAKSVIQKFGGEDVMKYLDESGLGNNPELVKMMHKIGRSLLEDTTRGGTAGGDLHLSDGTRAASEIENLKLDATFLAALTDAQNPGHRAAVDRWTNLHKVAHPGTQE